MKKFLQSEGFDIFFFIAIFLVIAYILAPYFYPQLRKRYECSQHNGNYTACVGAQQQGLGCAWDSGCNTCILATEGFDQCNN